MRHDKGGQDIDVEALDAFFTRTPRVAVAFSGGCDSSYVVAAARRAGVFVRAYLVRTAFQPSCEVSDAERVAAEQGVALTVIDADVLSERAICANSPERCYFCKRFIFSTILARKKADGFGDAPLIDGTNATDDPARRPGFRALAELGVVSVLRRANMSKDDVRAASRELGIFTADKPSFSCLAVHVPEGEPLTAAALLEAARLPEVVARLIARNAALGESLDTTCLDGGMVAPCAKGVGETTQGAEGDLHRGGIGSAGWKEAR